MSRNILTSTSKEKRRKTEALRELDQIGASVAASGVGNAEHDAEKIDAGGAGADGGAESDAGKIPSTCLSM